VAKSLASTLVYNVILLHVAPTANYLIRSLVMLLPRLESELQRADDALLHHDIATTHTLPRLGFPFQAFVCNWNR